MRLVLVGEGPPGEKLAREHPDVRFCGLRRGEDLATHCASGDVFPFPSETETFGNVTLEAMASGLAVVAYDYAGARMHIRDLATGVLVPYGRAREFATAAACLTAAVGVAARIGAEARAHALTAAPWTAEALREVAAIVAWHWLLWTGAVVLGRVVYLMWTHGGYLAFVWLVKLVTDPITDLLAYTPRYIPGWGGGASGGAPGAGAATGRRA